jgi:hypothetical protein
MSEETNSGRSAGEAFSTPDLRGIRVLQFAVRDPGYPRNARIRHFLQSRGASVTVLRAGSGSRLDRYIRMFRAALTRDASAKEFDAVILSEFSIEMFAFSWLAARRARAVHVVDFFVGLYETEVLDARRTKPGTFRAWQLRLADRGAVATADYLLTDTEERARSFTAAYSPKRAFSALPVGAPAWANASKDGRREGPARVLFYGTYLKLHGLESLVRGLVSAREHSTTDFTVTFIGDGPERRNIESLVESIGASELIELVGSMPATDLGVALKGSDVVLGVFGESEKARTVIPNKVWQGLYAGKVVVTQDSPALAELVPIVGDRLIQSKGNTPDAIWPAVVQALERASVESNHTPVAETLERYVDRQFAEAFTKVFELPLRGRRELRLGA